MTGRLLLMLAVAGALAGCSQSPATPTVVYDRATLDAKYQAISDMVKLPVCAASLQCGSVGIGAKPCGGPWRYIVYSRASVSEGELMRRVEDLSAYEAEYNRRNGIGSDCSFARPASAACVDGLCVDISSRP